MKEESYRFSIDDAVLPTIESWLARNPANVSKHDTWRSIPSQWLAWFDEYVDICWKGDGVFKDHNGGICRGKYLKNQIFPPFFCKQYTNCDLKDHYPEEDEKLKALMKELDCAVESYVIERSDWLKRNIVVAAQMLKDQGVEDYILEVPCSWSEFIHGAFGRFVFGFEWASEMSLTRPILRQVVKNIKKVEL